MNAVNKSRVVQIERQGSPSVLTYAQQTVDAPSGNNVLIRQKAIGLNFGDVLFRNGSFPLNPGAFRRNELAQLDVDHIVIDEAGKVIR
jgi:NADPH:quinone reductase-like Zn-dependent oxidoreductase